MRVITLIALIVVFSVIGCDLDDQIAGNSDTTGSTLFKARGQKMGHSERWIQKEAGGFVAGPWTGLNMIVIAPNSIPKSDWYTIDIYKGFQYGYAEFLPHTNFSTPALIFLDYSYFGLTDADVPQLKIYWYNEAIGTWEIVDKPTTINLTLNTVSFYVDHISKYAFGR